MKKVRHVLQGCGGGPWKGLKYIYRNPEDAIDLHLERLKALQGGSPATREVLTLGQEIATSLGFMP